MPKKRQVNKYLVSTYNPFMGPDGQEYSNVWGPITTVKNGYKIGFKTDHIILSKDEIQSRALVNVPPTPSDYVHTEVFEGKLVRIDMPWDTYVCTDKKTVKYTTANKLNKRLRK